MFYKNGLRVVAIQERSVVVSQMGPCYRPESIQYPPSKFLLILILISINFYWASLARFCDFSFSLIPRRFCGPTGYFLAETEFKLGGFFPNNTGLHPAPLFFFSWRNIYGATPGVVLLSRPIKILFNHAGVWEPFCPPTKGVFLNGG